MGESSRRDRSRSRSPSRKHRDRESRSSHHSSKHHKSHRHDDEEDQERHRKHRRDRGRDETEEERKERKRLKKEKRKSEGRRDGLDVVDDDDDGGMWVEKDIDAEVSCACMRKTSADRLEIAVSNVPTADSLPLKSQVEHANASLPHSTTTGTERRERDSWMLDPGAIDAPPTAASSSSSAPRSAALPTSGSRDLTDGYGDEETSNRTLGGGVDFFSSLGTEHKRKDPDANKPDPAKPGVDYRELNTQLKEGKSVDEYEAPQVKKVQPGGPGYQWRMTKLKRLYEQVAEQYVVCIS